VGGDFNFIYRVQDKSNLNVDCAMMGCFRHLLNDIELSEVHLMVRRLTWSNEREAPTLVRLDTLQENIIHSSIFYKIRRYR
jgi:hypothetical protein